MKSAREWGLIPDGKLAPGAGNAITDVPGLRVGHFDLRGPDLMTGVTAILSHAGDPFRLRPRGAVEVVNGFGKSAGLMQLAELGMIETPILLTNTFGVAACTEALIRRAIDANPRTGRDWPTVNPLVCECNDGQINDIQALAITPEHAEAALAATTGGPVQQGNVGAGSGMTSFGFKAGIGTASRRLDIGGPHVLGALVLANFGSAGDLVLPDGRRPLPPRPGEAERGSIIVVLATDLPLADRQLQRVARRGAAGLARLGAFWGHGSGDVVLCLTTADPVSFPAETPFSAQRRLADEHIDLAFRAAAEATQEAVLNALCFAEPAHGRDGRLFPALTDWLRENPRP